MFNFLQRVVIIIASSFLVGSHEFLWERKGKEKSGHAWNTKTEVMAVGGHAESWDIVDMFGIRFKASSSFFNEAEISLS